MGKQTIGIVFGGRSSEHEVSRVSAKSVLENIPSDKYDVKMVGITKDGQWKYYEGDFEKIPTGEWESDESCVPALISPDASVKGLVTFRAGNVETIRLDAVFPVLHGRNGEDGSIQGLMQLAGIPCVGCGVAASAICMDKAFTNIMCDANGISQAKWLQVNKYDYSKDGEGFCKKAVDYLGYPIFVKPANAGSSVGISKVRDYSELNAAIEYAFLNDSKIVLEEAIDGYEVECAVLGNDEPVASTVGEIIPCNDFYDYEAKYISDGTKLLIPSHLPEEKRNEIRHEAIRAYKACGCSGLSRMDFFVRKDDGKILFNEPNTLPGFTSISMYPKLFAAVGIEYSALLDRLIQLAIERTGE